MLLALLEAPALLLAADRKPELDQVNVVARQHALELRRLTHELQVLLVRAEAHHALDPGAVVPTAVEHNDLAGGWQVLHVTLEIPLAALGFTGFFQGDDMRATRVEVLHKALDRTTLAGRITAFEEDDHLLPGLFDPSL